MGLSRSAAREAYGASRGSLVGVGEDKGGLRMFFVLRECFLFFSNVFWNFGLAAAAGGAQHARNFQQHARNFPQHARNFEIRMCSVLSRMFFAFLECFLLFSNVFFGYLECCSSFLRCGTCPSDSDLHRLPWV